MRTVKSGYHLFRALQINVFFLRFIFDDSLGEVRTALTHGRYVIQGHTVPAIDITLMCHNVLNSKV